MTREMKTNETTQVLMPVLIAGCYAGLYLAFSSAVQGIDGIWREITTLAAVPCIYVIGSAILVLVLKSIQLLGLGK